MKIKTSRYENAGIIFLLSGLLFLILTVPFQMWFSIANITEMRPDTALTPVLGMICGLPAALGCGAGNLISDLLSGYGISYAMIGTLQQIIYAMVPYFLWRRLNPERDGSEFRLDSISRMLRFCLVMFIDALLIVFCTGILNYAYSVTEFFSVQNLYLFFKSFDAGLLYGFPILIGGHFLQKYLNNLHSDEKKKVFTVSLNERMIINTIITGIGICFLIGGAVYITDKMSAEGSTLSLWGQIYLFEMVAFNFYFALSMGFMWFTEKRIALPIENLAGIAERYYVEHSDDGQRREMMMACEKYAGDSTEVGNLARSYITMIRDMELYVDNLKSVTAEKERINAELSLASEIQAHMLPCIFPPFPEHKEFELYATMTPAKEVGGDFYDFFMLDETHLAVVIADVSGKGVPAALFMVIAKTLIKNQTQTGMEVNEVFASVNRLLSDGNDMGLFVTAWLGILELTSGKLTYVNAGHEAPLFKLKGGEFVYLKSKPGFVLALTDFAGYQKNELYMQPGDRLFLYTDGVTEATDTDKQLYGRERLLEFMNKHNSDGTEEVLRKLKMELDQFVGEAPQFDDITMLMLDFRKHAQEETV